MRIHCYFHLYRCIAPSSLIFSVCLAFFLPLAISSTFRSQSQFKSYRKWKKVRIDGIKMTKMSAWDKIITTLPKSIVKVQFKARWCQLHNYMALSYVPEKVSMENLNKQQFEIVYIVLLFVFACAHACVFIASSIGYVPV